MSTDALKITKNKFYQTKLGSALKRVPVLIRLKNKLNNQAKKQGINTNFKYNGDLSGFQALLKLKHQAVEQEIQPKLNLLLKPKVKLAVKKNRWLGLGFYQNLFLVSLITTFLFFNQFLFPSLITSASEIKPNSVIFSDIYGDKYGDKEIISMALLGVVGGYQDGQFKPEDKITTTQLAKMVHISLFSKNYQNNSCSQFVNVGIDNADLAPFYAHILSLKCEQIFPNRFLISNQLPIQNQVDNFYLATMINNYLQTRTIPVFTKNLILNLVSNQLQVSQAQINEYNVDKSAKNQQIYFYLTRRRATKLLFDINQALDNNLNLAGPMVYQADFSQYYSKTSIHSQPVENQSRIKDEKEEANLPTTPSLQNIANLEQNKTDNQVNNQASKTETIIDNSAGKQAKINWLTYPKYNISAPLIYSTDRDLFATTSDGKIDYSVLKEQSSTSSPIQKKLEKGVVHLGYTAKIGEVGNAFILGHSSNYAWVDSPYNNVFAPIMQKSAIGEEFFVYNQDGKELKFCVFETLQIKASDTFRAFQTFGDKRVVTLQTTVMSWENGVYGPNQRWLTRGVMC